MTTFKNNLVGKTFGRLTVLSYSGRGVKYHKWNCMCSCGKTKIVVGKQLVSGKTKSCGCLQLEFLIQRSTKHGERSATGASKLYTCWNNMKFRCSSDNTQSSKYYYDKGIKVCEDWQYFVQFRNWAISSGYEDGLEIDRINPELDYYPDNCRWVDDYMQNYNKGKYSNNTSGISGVCWNKNMKKWHARISLLGKEKHLGFFENFEDAVAVRLKYELLYYGEAKHKINTNERSTNV